MRGWAQKVLKQVKAPLEECPDEQAAVDYLSRMTSGEYDFEVVHKIITRLVTTVAKRRPDGDWPEVPLESTEFHQLVAHSASVLGWPQETGIGGCYFTLYGCKIQKVCARCSQGFVGKCLTCGCDESK